MKDLFAKAREQRGQKMGNAKIEVVVLRRLDNGGKLKAFADVAFEGSYIVKGFRIVEGETGLFVGFPQEIGKNGKWYNTFQTTDNEARNRLCEVIIASYME